MNMNDSPVKITISSSRVRAVLTYSVVALVVLNLIGLFFNYFLGYEYVYGFVPKFDLDTEHSIPTYFSALLLLTASCLLYAISTAMKKYGDIYAKHWLYLSIIFFCMSVDEASSIHELLVPPLRNAFDLSGVLYFSWVIVGFAAVVIVSIAYLRFLLNLPRNTQIGFVLAAGVYVSGVLGVELLGGFYSSNYGELNPVYALITTVEETLEMTGIVIFINALINFLLSNRLSIQLEIGER